METIKRRPSMQMLAELLALAEECGNEPFCIDDAFMSSCNERLFADTSDTAEDILRMFLRMGYVAQHSTAGGYPMYGVTKAGLVALRDCDSAIAAQLHGIEAAAAQRIDVEQDDQARRTLAATVAKEPERLGLCLTRKQDECVIVGDGDDACTVRVVEIRGERVRLSFDAKDHVRIDRAEVRKLRDAQ